MWDFCTTGSGYSTVRRRAVLLVGLCVLMIVGGGCAGGGDLESIHHSRTNVLLLTLCTLRADHLGVYGYELGVSPSIDSLATTGVIFDRAVAPASWTRASIASTTTGLYPRTLNIEEPSSESNNRQLHSSFQTLSECLSENGYYTIGITANPNTHSVFGFDQGYDFYEDTGKYLWRSGYSERKRNAEDVNASLLEQLRERPRDQKFFAHLTYVDVHAPLNDGAGEYVMSVGSGYPALYDRELRYLDGAIADLLREIGTMGVDDLLVIITSDHGEAFGQLHEGDTFHGSSLYNETIWVPFILNHPSLQSVKGRRAPRVELVSLVPTVLELLGVENDPPPTGGKSLEALVFDPDGDTPTPIVVSETCFGDANRSALIVSEWKLIATYKAGEPRLGEPDAAQYELYKLDNDPFEAQDLAAVETERVRELSTLLGGWQKSREPKDQGDDLDVEVSEELLRRLRSLGYIK